MDEKILGQKKIRVSGGALPDNFVAKFTLVIIDDLSESAKNEHAMKSLVIDFQKIRDEGNTVKLREMERKGTVRIKASECGGDPLAKSLAKLTPAEKRDLLKKLQADLGE